MSLAPVLQRAESPSSGLNVEIVRDIRAMTAEWDDLADRAGAPLFLRPGWMTAWRRAFGRGDVALITARSNGRLAGILPLERRGGAIHSMANHHTPKFGVIATDRRAREALLDRALHEASGRLALLMLDGDEGLDAHLVDRAADAGFATLARTVARTPYLRIDSSWEDVLGARSRKLRKEVRRSRRRLEEHGAVDLDVVRDPAGVDRHLDDLLALEASGWKRAAGTAIASHPSTHGFYAEVARWAATRGSLVLLFLRVGGRPIAVDLCVEDHGVRYMLKGGFDPAYARFSPGTILLEAGLDHAFSSELGRVELGGDADPYKMRWTGTTSARLSLEAFSPSFRGRADLLMRSRLLPLARSVRRRVRPTRS